MSSNRILFFEFLFFDVAALAFGIWQWWTVRPEKKKPAEPPPSEDSPGHPEG